MQAIKHINHFGHGLSALTPDEKDSALVSRAIFDELCLGEIRDNSRAEFLRIIDGLAARGAQGVILGCTVIGFLVQPADTGVPLFDTTLIRARGAARALMALLSNPEPHNATRTLSRNPQLETGRSHGAELRPTARPSSRAAP